MNSLINLEWELQTVGEMIHIPLFNNQRLKSNNSTTVFFIFQIWSEVNQSVLDYENRESTPKLAKLLKLLLWAQNELDQKKVKYPKMTDLSKGTIEDPK